MKSVVIRRHRRGATLVLVAGSMAALIGLSSLVVDIAVLYTRKQAHVNACDAAAIAGARELPDEAAAEQSARQTAAANGLTSGVDVFPGDNQILVQSQEDVPLLFARIFGMHTMAVGAQAQAMVGIPNALRPSAGAPGSGIPPVGGLRPLGIDVNYMRTATFGTEMTLKLGARSTSGDVESSGNFYPLRLKGDAGGEDFENNLKYGSDESYVVGDILDTEPGNKVGPMRQAADYLLDLASAAPWSAQTFQTAALGNPRVIILPIVDWTIAGNGQTQVQILGFAAFYVNGVQGQELTGRFLYNFKIANGDIEADPDPTGGPPPVQEVDGGTRVVQLVE